MRSSIKNIVFLILGGLIVASLMLLAFRTPWEFQSSHLTNSLDNPFQGMSLIAPPAYAIEATSTTPPLNTSRMSFIAYYQRISGWTLADTVPAFVNYFDGGNYYDGLVRVWDNGGIGATGSGAYKDVNVRVRADGWILAWFDRFLDDAGSIVWWGHTIYQGGSPPPYSTTSSRAIEIVFTVAGAGFSGYDMISMYDYSEPNATRLLIFGNSIYGGTANYYYTIPANSTMVPIKLLIRAGGYSGKLLVDGDLVYDKAGAGWWGWSTFEVNAWSKGVQHTISQYGDRSEACSVAFIMWSG